MIQLKTKNINTANELKIEMFKTRKIIEKDMIKK